jgi:hypothetical protein
MMDNIPSITPYNYCLDNPLRLADPSGMWVETPDGIMTTDPGEIERFLNALKSSAKQDVSKAITLTADFAHDVYTDLAKLVDQHPGAVNAANMALRFIKAPIENFREKDPDKMGWLDLFLVWVFEMGTQNTINFGPDAQTTKDLQHQEGVNQAREKANKALNDGKEQFTVDNRWVYGQKEFYDDIRERNGVTAFLGTYYTVVDVVYDAKTGTATYTFTVTNQTSWESGTRFRKAAKPGGPHQGIIPNKVRGTGIKLGGNLNEVWTWREIVVTKAPQQAAGAKR